MIFVSFGNHKQRFDRLAIHIDEYASNTSEEIIVQYGYTDFPFKNVNAFDFCTNSEMKNYLIDSTILILQGGWGTISDSIYLNKRIVVVPRMIGSEHIHDQIQLVKKLESLRCIIGVYDITDLSAKIEEAKYFNFQNLPRGDAKNIIETNISKWFQ